MADDNKALEGMLATVPAPEPEPDPDQPATDQAPADPPAEMTADPELVGITGDLLGQLSYVAHARWGVSPLDNNEQNAIAVPAAKLMGYYGVRFEGPAGAWIGLTLAGIGIIGSRVVEYRQIQADNDLEKKTEIPDPPAGYPETTVQPTAPAPVRVDTSRPAPIKKTAGKKKK